MENRGKWSNMPLRIICFSSSNSANNSWTSNTISRILNMDWKISFTSWTIIQPTSKSFGTLSKHWYTNRRNTKATNIASIPLWWEHFTIWICLTRQLRFVKLFTMLSIIIYKRYSTKRLSIQLQFFEDEVIYQLFNQVTGYQILLDLLYENERYADVLRIYNELKQYGRLHKNKYIDVIILATYYRLVNWLIAHTSVCHCFSLGVDWFVVNFQQNTPDALKKAYDLWIDISEGVNKVQFRKSRTFVAGLALKQNQPELALKILEGETTYVTMRHIKLLAWAQLNQFDKVFDMFRNVLKRHESEKKYNPSTSIDIVSCMRFIRFVTLYSRSNFD